MKDFRRTIDLFHIRLGLRLQRVGLAMKNYRVSPDGLFMFSLKILFFFAFSSWAGPFILQALGVSAARSRAMLPVFSFFAFDELRILLRLIVDSKRISVPGTWRENFERMVGESSEMRATPDLAGGGVSVFRSPKVLGCVLTTLFVVIAIWVYLWNCPVSDNSGDWIASGVAVLIGLSWRTIFGPGLSSFIALYVAFCLGLFNSALGNSGASTLSWSRILPQSCLLLAGLACLCIYLWLRPSTRSLAASSRRNTTVLPQTPFVDDLVARAWVVVSERLALLRRFAVDAGGHRAVKVTIKLLLIGVASTVVLVPLFVILWVQRIPINAGLTVCLYFSIGSSINKYWLRDDHSVYFRDHKEGDS